MIKQIFSILFACYAILFLSGCTAGLTDPEIEFKPPVYVEQMPSREDRQNFVSAGSIFGQGDNPLFSDHKAMHINDIVQVVISENAQSSNVAAKALNEDGSSTLGGGLFTPGVNAGSTVNKYSNRMNRFIDVSAGLSSSSEFAGSGSATKDASFTTTVSARIVKVLENGNYYISGQRELLIDKQKQSIQISGVIRPYDIDQYNKINSAQMSEAKISYVTEGDVDRATEQGWGTKIIQAIWPF